MLMGGVELACSPSQRLKKLGASNHRTVHRTMKAVAVAVLWDKTEENKIKPIILIDYSCEDFVEGLAEHKIAGLRRQYCYEI